MLLKPLMRTMGWQIKGAGIFAMGPQYDMK